MRYIKNLTVLISVLLLLSVFGCKKHDGTLLHMSGNEVLTSNWHEIIKKNPLGEKENIKFTDIGSTEHASYHLVQIKDKEEPHIHKDNDLYVIVKHGKGIMHIGKKSYHVNSGATIVVPKGVKHYYENTCSCGSVALVIFSPPFSQ